MKELIRISTKKREIVSAAGFLMEKGKKEAESSSRQRAQNLFVFNVVSKTLRLSFLLERVSEVEDNQFRIIRIRLDVINVEGKIISPSASTSDSRRDRMPSQDIAERPFALHRD